MGLNLQRHGSNGPHTFQKWSHCVNTEHQILKKENTFPEINKKTLNLLNHQIRVTFTDKKTNLYRLPKGEYNHMTSNAITLIYIKASDNIKSRSILMKNES